MSDTPRKRQPRMPIEARRDQILDAALRLISESGYAEASMEAIAREAAIAKPRVYAAYPGRGPLLHALLQREEGRVIAALATSMPPLNDGIDFEQTLLAAASNLLTAVADDPSPWRLLMAPTEGAPAEVHTHIQAGMHFALARLRELVEIGAETRLALDGLDVDLASRALLAVGERAVRDLLSDPTEFSADRYVDFLRDVVARVAGGHAVDP